MLSYFFVNREKYYLITSSQQRTPKVFLNRIYMRIGERDQSLNCPPHSTSTGACVWISRTHIKGQIRHSVRWRQKDPKDHQQSTSFITINELQVQLEKLPQNIDVENYLKKLSDYFSTSAFYISVYIQVITNIPAHHWHILRCTYA